MLLLESLETEPVARSAITAGSGVTKPSIDRSTSRELSRWNNISFIHFSGFALMWQVYFGEIILGFPFWSYTREGAVKPRDVSTAVRVVVMWLCRALWILVAVQLLLNRSANPRTFSSTTTPGKLPTNRHGRKQKSSRKDYIFKIKGKTSKEQTLKFFHRSIGY